MILKIEKPKNESHVPTASASAWRAYVIRTVAADAIEKAATGAIPVAYDWTPGLDKVAA